MKKIFGALTMCLLILTVPAMTFGTSPGSDKHLPFAQTSPPAEDTLAVAVERVSPADTAAHKQGTERAVTRTDHACQLVARKAEAASPVEQMMMMMEVENRAGPRPHEKGRGTFSATITNLAANDVGFGEGVHLTALRE